MDIAVRASLMSGRHGLSPHPCAPARASRVSATGHLALPAPSTNPPNRVQAAAEIRLHHGDFPFDDAGRKGAAGLKSARRSPFAGRASSHPPRHDVRRLRALRADARAPRRRPAFLSGLRP